MTRLLSLIAVAFLLGALPVDVASQEESKPKPPDYLIICADSLHDAAWEWAMWRTNHGRAVVVRKLSDISADKPPTLEAIREVVRKDAGGATITEGFQLLLIGDCPVEGRESYDPKIEIPWFMTPQLDSNPDPASRVRVPTDNFLADLVDDPDRKPDIAVGRIPARTLEQARAALAKVKAYEAAPAGEWMRNLTFFAGEGRFGASIDSMLERLFTQFAERTISQDYNVRMTYANIKSSYAYAPSRFSRKVLDEANAGSLMLVYMGHGQRDRLDNMYVQVEGQKLKYPILTSEDVNDFNITDGRLPVMLIVACETGHMDYDGECLAEKIVFHPKAPIAVLASSRDSHPYANTLLQKAFISEITENKVATLGEAMMKAKRELVEAKDPDRKQLENMAMFIIPKKGERDELNRSHISMYNLCGDPGLRLRHPSLRLKPALVESADRAAVPGGTIAIKVNVPSSAVLDGEDGKPPTTKWKVQLELQCRRTTIMGDLKTVPEKDLASPDADKRKAAEDVLAANHATSNNKRVGSFSPAFQGITMRMGKEELFTDLQFTAKLDNSLAPGDYILKVFALDEKGEACGFQSLELTVKEAPEKK
ncbi:MAG: hypothetical protein KF754_07700 [Planctomycetes bacterium]|nr:hypothetical protein [Planctomycetota bacterium]